jgi:DNA-directed RNA polymerase specialized sigma24 family protein
MPDEGSVTFWLRQLCDGKSTAAQQLWEGYFRRLVGLARGKLQGRARAAADEEDVALSAFASFCRGAERGVFPRLEDRDDLWQVLVLLTARKAARLHRRESALKRGSGEVLHASTVGESEVNLLEEVIGTEPTPEFAAELADEYAHLLAGFGDDEELRRIANWKLEGYSNAEIASRLGVVERTVERRLNLIRKRWCQAGEGE